MTDNNKTAAAHTLLDRFAVAFLSAVFAFVTGGLMWFFLALFNPDSLSSSMFAFAWVFWFTALMAVLGFLLLDNLLASFYGRVWQALYHLFILILGGRP